MKVLLVEPLGHRGGHLSAHTKYLSGALADAGANVTVVTFDGLLGEAPEWNADVKHISFVPKSGALGPVWRFLLHRLPRPLNSILVTICVFRLAVRQDRKEKNDVIHILDAALPDYAFPWFGSLINRHCVTFTLFFLFRQVRLKNRQARLADALSKGQILTGFRLCLGGLFRGRPANAFKGFLYRRADRRNRLAFICYTKAVHDSYSDSPYYDKIVRMPRGVAVPERGALQPVEARRILGLSQDGAVLLHFGSNHSDKNFEVIFQAAKDLPEPYTLLFAGKGNPVHRANNPVMLAKKYGLGQNTIIADRYIPEEEMPDYFHAADATLLSYRKHFGRASGVLSTTAQFSLPVIASDVGEIGEAVRNYGLGLTFEAENAQSLREAILSFLNLKEEQKQEMKRNLLRFAQDHSWQVVARRHIEVYQSLLLQSGRHEKMNL
jgi:glycosyltransferase involved in cell wall biosynthesis